MPRAKVNPSRVWWLTGAIAAVTVGIAWWLRDATALFDTPVNIQWWMLAAAFYVFERTVVHFRFNRHAYSFSLSEIPMVLGMFLVAPVMVLAAQALGVLVALTTHRRQTLTKASFNLAQFGLQTAVAILVFRMLADARDPLAFRNSVSAWAAAITAWFLANLLISTAIRLSGGEVTRQELANVLLAGVAAATMNVGLGIVTVFLLWLRPEQIWLAAIPVGLLYVSYRAYMVQRQEHGRLSAIYEATRELHRIPQLEEALVAMVRRARTVFEGDFAAIHLFPDGPHRTVFTTSHGPDGLIEVMEANPAGITDPHLLMALSDAKGFIMSTKSKTDTIVAPLIEDDNVVGLFVVTDPVGDVGEFTRSDLNILETMASQVAVSLENGRLEDSLAQLTRLKEELKYQALHDPLTGLANRVLLRSRLEESALRRDPSSALIFIDLDHFKSINDTFGHQGGDRALVEIAQRLQTASRDHDVVARIGGDEFAILLTRLSHPQDAEAVARRILESVRAPIDVGAGKALCGASVGIAHVMPGDHSDDILRRADQAMYSAKHRGRGSYQVFGASMDEEVRRSIRLRMDFQAALMDDAIELHYQPIISLTTRQTEGAEALLRWIHPDLGVVNPLETLTAAAEASAIDLLASWTVDRVCRDLSTIRHTQPNFLMTLNVSPDQLNDSMVDHIRAALHAYKIPAGQLIVELTETSAVQGSPDAIEALAGLGVKVAIDDFGTGYSSLSRLDTLPINVVKIDRSFVDRMVGPGSSPLARMVLEIGEALDLMTVAEGIETVDQLRELVEMGCDYGQGFLFAGAMRLGDLLIWIESSLTTSNHPAILAFR